RPFTICHSSSTTLMTGASAPSLHDARPISPCSVAVTGAGGLNEAPAPTYADNTNAGTATASYTFAGDANHAGSNGSKTFAIGQAASTVTVTCPATAQTYTGAAIDACTATVTGANLNLTVTPSYGNNVNVGTATASYTFAADANHAGSTDSKTFAIGKATSTVTVSCPTAAQTYTGSAIEACTAKATGAGGLNQTLTVGYTNNVNVGTANASASYTGDGNHEGNSN